MFSKSLQRFVDHAPVCVLIRLAMERAMGPAALDELFGNTAQKQYQRELLFSSVVGVMTQVVCGSRRSVHQACQQSLEDLAVSLTSFYNKLNGLEPAVSAALVRHSAQALQPLIHRLRQDRPSLLGGYPVRIVDGNHLAGTEHRLQELRTLRSAALPGEALVVLDPISRLVLRAIPCENAHAQERSLFDELLEEVKAGELWLADRNFCTTRMLFGLIHRQALFILRQHASTLHWRELSRWRSCGRIDSGRVLEQLVEVREELTGQAVVLRRVKLELDEPTRDGEREILLLTNLPAEAVSAKQVAQAYQQRWTIERAFAELAVALRGEINTLGYPRAALFGFCVALAAYNLVSLVKASLGAVHGRQTVEEQISGYHLAAEWAAVYEGMVLALGPRVWSGYGKLEDRPFVAVLKALAEAAKLRRYRKAKRGPKKKRPERKSGKRIHHVATAKLLAQRKTVTMTP